MTDLNPHSRSQGYNKAGFCAIKSICKVAWNCPVIHSGWLCKGDDFTTVLYMLRIWIVWTFALLVFRYNVTFLLTPMSSWLIKLSTVVFRLYQPAAADANGQLHSGHQLQGQGIQQSWILRHGVVYSPCVGKTAWRLKFWWALKEKNKRKKGRKGKEREKALGSRMFSCIHIVQKKRREIKDKKERDSAFQSLTFWKTEAPSTWPFWLSLRGAKIRQSQWPRDRASASRAVDLGSNPNFPLGNLWWLRNWYLSGCPSRHLAFRVSGRNGWISVNILWLNEIVWSAPSLLVWQHVQWSQQIYPWAALTCCWDIKQPNNRSIRGWWSWP